MPHIPREIRFAVRRALRRPWVTLAAGLSVGLGVGVSVAAYSAVDSVLLRPLPVHAQDEVFVFWQRDPVRDFPHVPLTPDGFQAVRDARLPVRALGAYEAAGARAGVVERGGERSSIDFVRVAGDFFGTLGADAALGRTLTREDDALGAAPVAFLSHEYWVREMGSDPGVVGSVIRLENRGFEVVGVGPGGFSIPAQTEIWVSLRGAFPDWASAQPVGVELDLVGRLEPGATLGQLSESISRIVREAPNAPAIARDWVPVVTTLEEHMFGSMAPLLWVVLGAALVLLGVAAANTVLLLLTGGGRLVHEAAVRRALGAARNGIVLRVLADATLTCAVAVLVGVGTAWVVVEGVLPLAPADLARLGEVSLDGVGFTLAIGLAFIASMGAGGTAGWVLAGRDPTAALMGAGRSGSGRVGPLHGAIAISQIALAVTVAVGAGLLLRTVSMIGSLEAGFRVADVSVVSLTTPYPMFQTPEGHVSTLERALERLRAVPGINAATFTVNTPMVVKMGVDVVPRLDGQEEGEWRNNPFVGYDAVLPGYFDAMEIELVSGRPILSEDRSTAEPAVVVNQEAARRLWPGEDPLGKRLSAFPGYPEVWGTVVGVVQDTRYRALLEERAQLYVPFARLPGIAPGRLVIGASGPGPGPLRQVVSDVFADIDPSMQVTDVQSLEALIREPLVRPRFAAVVLLAFAGATLVLAMLGVYGVFTALVAGRMREFGVRKAVGANGRDLIRLVIVQVTRTTAIGAGAGIVVSIWAAGALDGLLFGVVATDPGTLFGVAVGAMAIGIGAALLPALRAGGVDPLTALRSE